MLWQVEIKKTDTNASIIHRDDTMNENSCGLDNSRVGIPQMDGNDILNFYIANENDQRDNFPAFSKTYKDICNIISDNYELPEDDAEYETLIRNVIKIDEDASFPVLTYEDITEQELFGFDPIPSTTLESKEAGLWARHGKRKFKFRIDKEKNDNDKDVDITTKLYFYNCDNLDIGKIEFSVYEDQDAYYSMIDTDELGDFFTDDNNQYRFEGNLEIIYTYKSVKGYSKTEVFPVIISLQNTHYNPHKCICSVLKEDTFVSIDFGTSSTCIAINTSKGIELLALSPTNENKEENVSHNRFENPTNIMIYRWDKIYEEWVEKASKFPHLLKGRGLEADDNIWPVEFDSGYTVKEVLHETNKKALDSILTEIKMIPYLIDKEKQPKVNPYILGDTKVINIVDDPEKQDKEHFDPVAFYGYLLGRAINNPSKKSVYTKYDISYPAKFNKTVKNKIKNSLEYGLKMSLPDPLRDAVDSGESRLFSVEMKYSEPEAYIGAIIDKKLLNCDEKPQLFSVFDFGGGTLDFSFGLFAKEKRSSSVFDKRCIYFFGSGGKANFGGEYLISRISFWILTDESNKGQIIENNILLEIPEKERIPSGFPESIFNKSLLGKTNMRILNERISRDLFEDKVTKESDTVDIQFFSDHGNPIAVSLSIDYSILRDKLSDLIDTAVEDFKYSIELALNENIDTLTEYGVKNNIDDVHIFKSGNASRSSLVTEKMSEKFPSNKIYLIDEVEELGVDMRYAMTPKTAVARGQFKMPTLKLIRDQGYGINGQERGFQFNWNILQGDSTDYNIIINQFEKGQKWKPYSCINDGRCTIYYSKSPNTNVNDIELYTHKCKNKDGFLYICIADENSISCYESKEEITFLDDFCPSELDIKKITLKE